MQESLTGVCSCLGEPHRGQGTSAGWSGGGGTGQLKFFKVFPAPILPGEEGLHLQCFQHQLQDPCTGDVLEGSRKRRTKKEKWSLAKSAHFLKGPNNPMWHKGLENSPRKKMSFVSKFREYEKKKEGRKELKFL